MIKSENFANKIVINFFVRALNFLMIHKQRIASVNLNPLLASSWLWCVSMTIREMCFLLVFDLGSDLPALMAMLVSKNIGLSAYESD